METNNLRALAKGFANGVIDKESYRKARTRLIEDVISGKIKVEEKEFLKPIDVSELSDTAENTVIQPQQPPTAAQKTPSPSPPSPPPQQTPVQPSNIIWLVTSAVVIVICVAVITLLYLWDNEPQKVKTSRDILTTVIEETEPVPSDSPAQLLIEHFLDSNNWSESSLQQFLTDWGNLTPYDRSVGLTSPAISRLINSIYQQLLEERALVGLGNTSKIIERQKALVSFAEQLGIRDPRLVVEDTELKIESQDEVTPIEEKVETEITTTMDKSEQAPPVQEEVTEPDKLPKSVDAGTDIEETEVRVAEQKASESITLAETTIEEPVKASPTVIPEQPAKKSEEATSSTATSSPVNKSACTAALAKQRKPYCRDIIVNLGSAPTMVVIPAGKFQMGGEKPIEQPRHDVNIGYTLAVSVNEITHGDFEKYCQSAKKQCPQQPWSGKDYPVVNISWHDAVAYTQWLSDQTGNDYRLPSEAEWEYAARARTKTPYPFGNEILITDAVFSDRKEITSPLPKTDRSINRNKFKLYHMVGNVREWVLDAWYEGYNGAPVDGSARNDNNNNLKVVRGGSYADSADELRSGARTKLQAGTADVYTGFRVVQVLNQ